MPQAVAQTNFTAGELSPRMAGRFDLAAYQNGVALLENMVPLVQGPVTKRPGSIFADRAASDASRSRLIGFTPQLTQGYIIEASNLKFRFFTNDVLLTGSDVTTPWGSADLDALYWQASSDVLYIVDGKRQQRKLTRTGPTTFSLATMALTKGPFKDSNTDKSQTVYASANTGSVTLTASAPIFAAGHVGGLFYLETQDFSSIPAWEPDYQVALNDLRRSDGKVYKAVGLPASGSTRTGNVQPIHSEGRERDGTGSGQDRNAKDAGGVLWEYQYGRFGILTITAFTSATQVTATVTTTLPADVVGSGKASWRWALGAFSDAEGWPQCVALWNERLIFARGNELFASVVGDFANFSARTDAGLLAADQAWRIRLPGSDAIRWLSPDRTLLIGTASGEYVILPLNNQQAVSASNISAPRQSAYGSSDVPPVASGTRTLFVQRGGRKLRQMGYDFQADRYVSADLTIRSHHVTRGGISELAFQQEPEALMWAVRGDGQLVCLTFIEDESVRGWSRLLTAGAVESIAVIPAPDGGSDQLWMQTRRTIGGVTRRFIERLAPFREDGEPLAYAYFVDCGLTYQGAATATLAGLDHLAGETVAALVNGAVMPPLVVGNDGRVTLPDGVLATTASIGLPFTGLVKTMKLEAPANDGSIQGRLKRIVKLVVRLLDTFGARIGGASGARDEIFRRNVATPLGSPEASFTGDIRVPVPGGFNDEGVVFFESRDPLPATLLLLAPAYETGNA